MWIKLEDVRNYARTKDSSDEHAKLKFYRSTWAINRGLNEWESCCWNVNRKWNSKAKHSYTKSWKTGETTWRARYSKIITRIRPKGGTRKNYFSILHNLRNPRRENTTKEHNPRTLDRVISWGQRRK